MRNTDFFARNLRACRIGAGMTQEQLAEKIGYSKKTVSKWETGAGFPSILTVKTLAAVLHTTSDALLAEDGGTYYLGIDGGGTKTEFLLRDAKGETVSSCIRSASNPNDVGMTSAQAALDDGIRTVCGNIPFSRVFCYAGIAGGTSGQNRAALLHFLASFGFARCDCGSDNENIIAAGLGGGDGITLIVGTGICAFTVKDGSRTRTSGWGYLLDRGGSAYNFGNDALYAYYAALDGTGIKTSLTEAVRRQSGLEPNELLAKLYAEGKRYIASFAHLVFEEAEKGDAAAQEIVLRNAEAVKNVLSAASSPFGDAEGIRVVLSGGLTGERYFLDRLHSVLPANRYALSVLPCRPVEGALLLARALNG